MPYIKRLSRQILIALGFFAFAAMTTTPNTHAMKMDMEMKPMVEMPSNMSKSDFPSGEVHMMMTPDGEKAFVPWYLTKGFKSMSRMSKGSMAEGAMMQMDDGSFAFVPWYLAPQFSMTMTKKMDMQSGMMMMKDGGMSYVFVPWYKQ